MSDDDAAKHRLTAASADPPLSRSPNSSCCTVRRYLLATLCISLLCAACGPVRSTQAISKAEVQFERARVVGAHKKAPYEYYSAKQYLHKAKEEWGYSEFEAALDFAEQAEQAAESARRKAKEDPWEDPVDRRNGDDQAGDSGGSDKDDSDGQTGDEETERDEESSQDSDKKDPVSKQTNRDPELQSS